MEGSTWHIKETCDGHNHERAESILFTLVASHHFLINPSVIGKGHFEKREELLSQKWRKFCQTTIPTARRSPGKKTLRMLRYRKNVTWTVFLKYVTVVSKGIDFHKGTGVKLSHWWMKITKTRREAGRSHSISANFGKNRLPLWSVTTSRCSIKHILAPLPNSDSGRFTGQCLPVQRQMFLNTAEEANNSTLKKSWWRKRTASKLMARHAVFPPNCIAESGWRLWQKHYSTALHEKREDNLSTWQKLS